MSATRTAERESAQIPPGLLSGRARRTSAPGVAESPSMGRCTPTRGPPCHMHGPARHSVQRSAAGGPFDYDAGGPISIRPFDAITFSLGDLWP